MFDSYREYEAGRNDYPGDEDPISGREPIRRRNGRSRSTESPRSLRKSRQIPLSANSRGARRSTSRALAIGKLREAPDSGQ